MRRTLRRVAGVLALTAFALVLAAPTGAFPGPNFAPNSWSADITTDEMTDIRTFTVSLDSEAAEPLPATLVWSCDGEKLEVVARFDADLSADSAIEVTWRANNDKATTEHWGRAGNTRRAIAAPDPRNFLSAVLGRDVLRLRAPFRGPDGEERRIVTFNTGEARRKLEPVLRHCRLAEGDRVD